MGVVVRKAHHSRFLVFLCWLYINILPPQPTPFEWPARRHWRWRRSPRRTRSRSRRRRKCRRRRKRRRRKRRRRKRSRRRPPTIPFEWRKIVSAACYPPQKNEAASRIQQAWINKRRYRQLRRQRMTRPFPTPLQSMLDWAAATLVKNGFSIDPTAWHIDFHRYTRRLGDEIFASPLEWHRDNKGGVPWDCVTLIVYLSKSGTISGGNFRYVDQQGHIVEVDVTTGTIIMMDGDIVHKPTGCGGVGVRESIVIQFKSV